MAALDDIDVDVLCTSVTALFDQPDVELNVEQQDLKAPSVQAPEGPQAFQAPTGTKAKQSWVQVSMGDGAS